MSRSPCCASTGSPSIVNATAAPPRSIARWNSPAIVAFPSRAGAERARRTRWPPTIVVEPFATALTMKVDTVNIYLVTTGKLHPVVVELVTDEGIAGHRRSGDRLRPRRHGRGGNDQGPRRANDRRLRSGADRDRSGRRCTTTRSGPRAAARSCSPASARSSRRSGTSRARRSASRCTSCSAAGCGTRSASTPTAGTARRALRRNSRRRPSGRCATATAR